MAFEIQNLNELDSTLVNEMLEASIARLQEAYPELDLKRGVFHDTVAYFHAMLEAAVRTNLARYLSGRSLKEIEADPTLADDDVVDSVLSLYRIERKAGTLAVGQVTVVVSDNTTVTIPSGSTWVADGQSFVTTQAFSGKAEAALISDPSDRLMSQLSDDTYAFQIDVEAVVAGADSKLDKDTKVIPAVQPINYLTSYATEDFSDGTPTQTNAELLEQLQYGMAAKALRNRVNMRAALLEVAGFSGIADMSIVGYGDAEMLRDQHSLMPLSFGGRLDWYIRGQRDLKRVTLSKEAVLISKVDGVGTWQFSVARDDAPGFYELRNIRLTGANALDFVGGFTITNEQRGLDLTSDGFIPDIETQEEGEYSCFQTSVVQFEDTITNVTDVAIGTKQLYEVEAITTPLIAEVQDYVSSRDVRNHGADALVKAPVPCFVQVNLVINKKTSDAAPDTDAIKQAVLEVVNSVSFVGRLDASPILDAIHAHLSGGMSVTKMDLFGRVRRPDGTDYYLRNPESIVVKDDPQRMVTAKTVQFYAERDKIAVTVENSVPLPS